MESKLHDRLRRAWLRGAALALTLAAPALALPEDPECVLGARNDLEVFIRAKDVRRDADLSQAIFYIDADLRGADFRGANLAGSLLTGTDCTGANFSGVDLRTTCLKRATLDECNFHRARLSPEAYQALAKRGVKLDGALCGEDQEPAQEAPDQAASDPAGQAFPVAAGSGAEAWGAGAGAGSGAGAAAAWSDGAGSGPAAPSGRKRKAPEPWEAAGGEAQASPAKRPKPDPLAKWIKHLQAYHKDHGHLKVPTTHRTQDGKSLYNWIHRKRSTKQQGKLKPHQVAALEAVEGWSWEDPLAPPSQPAIAGWIAILEAYRKEHGHLKVPTTYRTQDGKSLYDRILRIREDKRWGALAPATVRALEAVEGWSWEGSIAGHPGHLPFKGWIERLNAFREAHGHLNVPYTNRSLHSWISRVRKKKQENALGRDKVRALEAVEGWSWKPAGAGKAGPVGATDDDIAMGISESKASSGPSTGAWLPGAAAAGMGMPALPASAWSAGVAAPLYAPVPGTSYGLPAMGAGLPLAALAPAPSLPPGPAFFQAYPGSAAGMPFPGLSGVAPAYGMAPGMVWPPMGPAPAPGPGAGQGTHWCPIAAWPS